MEKHGWTFMRIEFILGSQYLNYAFTSISPSVFYVPGAQSASIVSTYISPENATTYELLVVTNDQNFTYDVEKK